MKTVFTSFQRTILVFLISFSLIFNSFSWVNAIAFGVLAVILWGRFRMPSEPPNMGIILLLGTFLRLITLFFPGYEPFGDFSVYASMARDIQQGDYLFCLDKQTGPSIVYAGIGWLFGSIPAGGLTLNLILQVFDIRLAYLIGKRWRTEKIGRWCALALAIYPDHIYYTHLLSSEVFFTTGLLLVVFLLIRSPSGTAWWLGIGAVIGIMNYFRPLAPLLLPAAAVFEVSRRCGLAKTVANLALMTFVFLLTVLPQSLHTYQHTGNYRITSSQTGGMSMLFATTNEEKGAFQLDEYNRYLELESECASTESLHPLVCANQKALKIAKGRISERTFVWLKYTVTDRLPLQFGGSGMRWAWPDRPMERWRSLFHLGSHFFTALLWLAFVAFLVLGRIDDPIKFFFTGLILLVFLTHFVTEVNPRYAHPWTVLLLLFVILNGRRTMNWRKSR